MTSVRGGRLAFEEHFAVGSFMLPLLSASALLLVLQTPVEPTPPAAESPADERGGSALEPTSPPETVSPPAVAFATTTTAEKLLFDPAERAQAACRFRGDDWECLDLQHFNARLDVSVDHPADLKVSIMPSVVDDAGDPLDCVRSIAVSLQHPDSELLVDWSRATLTVDGVAKQAVPGFARQLTVSLDQRRSVAEAGSVLAETVHSLDGECIAPSTPSEAGRTIVLGLPVEIGSQRSVVRSTAHLVWQPAEEKDVIALLPVADVMAADGWPWVATTVGFSLGGLLAIVPAIVIGAETHQRNLRDGLPLAIAAGVGIWAAATLVYGGCCAFVGWCFFDRPAQQRLARAEENNRQREALLEKREALGLEMAY